MHKALAIPLALALALGVARGLSMVLLPLSTHDLVGLQRLPVRVG